MQICQALALGLMIAGTAIMSQYLGANQTEKAKKVSGQLLILSVLIGIIFNLLLFLMAPLILQWMGADTSSICINIRFIMYNIGLLNKLVCLLFMRFKLVVSQLAIQSHQLF